MSQYSRITRFLILLGFLVLLFAGLSAPLTYAQAPAEPYTKVTLDLVDYRGGTSNSIFATEAHIYANFGYKFAILERIDDTTFRQVGFTLLADRIHDIHVDGQYAYIVGSTGLHVIDVSDPANPTVVAEIASRADRDLVVANGYAYLVGETLDIIDVSQPAQPTLVCTRCGAEHGVDVNGHVAALQDSLLYIRSYQKLNIYDISDPTTPSLLGTYQWEHNVLDLSVQGQFAYVTTIDADPGSLGLDIVNIANPRAPALVEHIQSGTDGSWWPDSPRFNLVVDGQHAYAVVPGNQLWIVDISTPSEPTTASLTPFPVTDDRIVPHAITKVGSNLYVTLQGDGFIVLDVTDPSAPNHVITSASHSQPVGRFVNLKAPYLYAGGGIFDISNPASPQLAGQYQGEIRLIQGQYGFGLDPEWNFAIFDLSQPLTPTIAGTYPLGSFGGFAVANNHAYVLHYVDCDRVYGDCYPRLEILDISDPEQPRQVAKSEDMVPASLFVVRGSYLYTSGNHSFYIYDISDPAAPRKVGSYTPPEPGGGNHFSIRGHFVFLAAEEGGLQIIDIRDPANPVAVGNHSAWVDKVLHVTDRYAYVTSKLRFEPDEGVLDVIDITDVTNPEAVGRYLHPLALVPKTGEDIVDIAVGGEYVYQIGNGLFTLHQQEFQLPFSTYLPAARTADCWGKTNCNR